MFNGTVAKKESGQGSEIKTTVLAVVSLGMVTPGVQHEWCHLFEFTSSKEIPALWCHPSFRQLSQKKGLHFPGVTLFVSRCRCHPGQGGPFHGVYRVGRVVLRGALSASSSSSWSELYLEVRLAVPAPDLEHIS